MSLSDFPLGIYKIIDAEADGVRVYFEHDETKPDEEHSTFHNGQTFSVFEVVEGDDHVWGRISDYKGSSPEHYLPLQEGSLIGAIFIQEPI